MGKPCIIPIKQPINNKQISVIIPTAGIGKRMKSFGAKALLDIGGMRLIDYQIKTIKSVLPNAEIIIIVGFESEKVCNILPKGIRVVENDNFENTSIVKSISCGIRACIHNEILIMPGDILINKKGILDFAFNKSAVLLDNKDLMPKESVGVICDNNIVKNFAYTLMTKWTGLLYIEGNESPVFQKLVHDKKNTTKYLFEILNSLLDKEDCKLYGKYSPETKILKIYNPKDIGIAKSINWQ